MITANMLEDLRRNGYKYKNVDDIFLQQELPSEAVEIILKYLPAVYEEHLGTGDHLCRSLILAAEPFNPAPLIDFFEKNCYNPSIIWGVGLMLSTAKTTDISDWLKHQLLDEEYTFQRSSLLLGLVNKGKFDSAEQLMDVMKKLFKKYSFHERLFKIFAKYGSDSEILFLEEEKKTANDEVSKQIDKVIKRIKSRKRNPIFPPTSTFFG